MSTLSLTDIDPAAKSSIKLMTTVASSAGVEKIFSSFVHSDLQNKIEKNRKTNFSNADSE